MKHIATIIILTILIIGCGQRLTINDYQSELVHEDFEFVDSKIEKFMVRIMNMPEDNRVVTDSIIEITYTYRAYNNYDNPEITITYELEGLLIKSIKIEGDSQELIHFFLNYFQTNIKNSKHIYKNSIVNLHIGFEKSCIDVDKLMNSEAKPELQYADN